MKQTKRVAKVGILVLTAVLVLAAAVTGVYAYITAQTPPQSNQFEPTTVTCAVEETFDGQVKKNVAVRNTGEIDAYIRATVVATWVNDSGQVWAVAPVQGTDYTITWGTSGWIKSADGFWYYDTAVAAGNKTADLIRTATVVTAPKGYHLQMQVLATAIQAAPDKAVEDAWGVTVNNGVIIPK